MFGWSVLLTTPTVFHLKEKKKEEKKKRLLKKSRKHGEKSNKYLQRKWNPSWKRWRARAHSPFTKLWSNRLVLHFDCSYCRERSVGFCMQANAAQVDAVRSCVCPIEMYPMLFSLYFGFIGISVTLSISPRRSVHFFFLLFVFIFFHQFPRIDYFSSPLIPFLSFCCCHQCIPSLWLFFSLFFLFGWWPSLKNKRYGSAVHLSH